MASTSKRQFEAENGRSGGIVEFMARFSDERTCADYLLDARNPGGWVCPRCGNRRCTPMSGRTHSYQCTRCSKQVSVTAGTVMEGTKVPLSKWFYALYVVSHTKRGLSGTELARTVEVNERTGASMLRRIRGAMAGSECL